MATAMQVELIERPGTVELRPVKATSPEGVEVLYFDTIHTQIGGVQNMR